LTSAHEMTPEERQAVSDVLGNEYTILMSALNAAWSASLVRTSIFLVALSAAGVALGFVAQGGLDSASFTNLALVVLPLVLFLGIATFVEANVGCPRERGGIALSKAGALAAGAAAAVAFVATLMVLFTYWQRSLAEIQSAVKPLYPTPPDEVDAPF